jgi:hypothetical protein
MLQSEGVPFFRDCLSIVGLRHKLETAVFDKALVMKIAKDSLIQS